MPDEPPLPVTERTRHRRLREQSSTDRADPAGIPVPPHIAALIGREAGR